MKRFAFLLMVVLPLAAQAADPAPAPVPAKGLKAPETVEGRRDKLTRVVVEAAGKVSWKIPPGVDVEILDGGKKLICAAEPGTYMLIAAAASGDEVVFADVRLVIAGQKPDTPTPPMPPTPPAPDGEFEKAIRQAFGTGATQKHKDDAARLAALYRLAVKECKNKEHVVCDNLLVVIRTAALGIEWESTNKLTPVREAVANELAKIAEPESPLSDDLREKLESVYGRAASVLALLSK